VNKDVYILPHYYRLEMMVTLLLGQRTVAEHPAYRNGSYYRLTFSFVDPPHLQYSGPTWRSSATWSNASEWKLWLNDN